MNCNHYYLIDALNADGQPVRKRKYRREDSKIQTWWFDWRNLPIDDAEEKARVEALATTHTQIDEGFEEDARFMQRVNKVGSVENLPMDAHVIEVAWAPNGVAGELSFSLDKGLDGDTYKVLVTNTGDHPATLFLPRVADTIRMSTEEGAVDNAGTTYILLYPSQVAYVEAAYNAGKWTFSMVRATAKDLAQHVIPAVSTTRLFPSHSARHPRWRRIRTEASTSRRRGQCRSTERPGCRMVAARMGSTLFLAPWTVRLPSRGRPPKIS